MTAATEQFKRNYLITLAVSWALTIVPLIVFAILGMANGDVSTTTKVSLGLTLSLVLGMTVVNVFSKLNLKLTLIWGVMLVLYATIDHFLAAILTMFICTALDEVIVSPMNRYYKRKYLHNKDADERDILNGKVNTQGTEGTNS